jgi:hypothetical protein
MYAKTPATNIKVINTVMDMDTDMDTVDMDTVVMDTVVMDTVVMDTVVTDTVVMDTVVMDIMDESDVLMMNPVTIAENITVMVTDMDTDMGTDMDTRHLISTTCTMVCLSAVFDVILDSGHKMADGAPDAIEITVSGRSHIHIVSRK